MLHQNVLPPSIELKMSVQNANTHAQVHAVLQHRRPTLKFSPQRKSYKFITQVSYF